MTKATTKPHIRLTKKRRQFLLDIIEAADATKDFELAVALQLLLRLHDNIHDIKDDD